jgi:hypothetical protein
MDEELQDAADRLSRDKYDDYGKMEFWKFSPARMEDVCRLANAYLVESAELARLRALLSEVSDEFLSGMPCETHGDWCLTHSTNHCRADELRAKVKAAKLA